ncbi:hypothetical protein GQ457_07G010550 [Hibiscus cannabinus]
MNPSDIVSATTAAGIIGSHGGRPPDSVITIDGSSALERPRSPSVTEIQPFTKKGRCDMDMNVDDGTSDSMEMAEDAPSFKDKLLGSDGGFRTLSSLSDLDVEVLDDDIRIGGTRYRALLNRIQLLWKPKGEFSLIDLDNNYFLVRFEIADDFQNVLLGGPWVIFGSYLTVQPWSRYFSTKEEYPSQIMVWVRLPKLPYRYYTKNLFRHIAASIGKVVRIDYNTTEGKRGRFARLAIIVDLKKPLVFGIIIDGQRQDIEYEGLPEICFKDPNKLYGPWMHVMDRRRRVQQQIKDVTSMEGGSSGKADHRSRFAVLADVPDDNGIGSGQTFQEAPAGSLIRDSSRVQQSGVAIPTLISQPVLGGVASSGKVVMAKSNLRADKNVAVQVLEPGILSVSKEVRGHVLPSSLKGGSSRNNSKAQGINLSIKQPGIKPKKREERVVGKSSLASGLSNLLSNLDNAEAVEIAKQNSVPSSVQGVDSQGALDPTLHKSFKLIVRKQIPDIAVVMEPRISGRAADVFIRKAGFDYSFRVEARGFSGGIWVMWRDLVQHDMLAVSNQYIHGLCSVVGDGKTFFVTFVYASPNPVRRRSLWDHLKALEPDNNTPWVIGGDLNVISISIERQGGSPYRLNVCRDFGDFFMDTGLLNMGFNGPKFTWKQRMLSQRLDRCLCNSDCYGLFPLSEVYHLIKLGSDHRPILLDTSPCTSLFGERPFRYIVAWNDHPRFDEFLRHVWSDSVDMATNVSSFRDESRSWNCDVFGHIGRRKNLLMARIKGVEQALEDSCSPFLENLEEDLKRELFVVLDQEESLWHQKARARWIEKGDRNTTFFHTAATMRWKHNSIRMLRLNDGAWSFSSRSTYAYLTGVDVPSNDTIWKYIWSLKVPQCIRTFLWVTLHQRHLTNAERFRRHFAQSALCPICYLEVEDLDHILRRCLPARNLWTRVVPSDRLSIFLNLPLANWLRDNLLHRQLNSSFTDGWDCQFAVFCWLLSKDRCTTIFDSQNASTEDILTRGLRLAVECNYVFVGAPGQNSPATVLQLWSRPSMGWVKANVDASVNPADGKASIGCVIRDEHGNWIQGFFRDVGRCSVLLAELWEVHDSLVQAWSLDFRHVIVETDCLEIIRILKRSSRALMGNNLVESILLWTRKEWQLVVQHVPRHQNSIADRFAALGQASSSNGLSLLFPPADLISLIE